MKTFLLCGALSLLGLVACVEPQGAAPDPAAEPETAELRSHATEELTGALPATDLAGGCCIDYTCPSDGFITTGCRTGAGPSIAEARAECNAGCPVLCSSSGLYCD